ncbi:MAG: hypothetical protein F6J87_17990 [Spirulina sp. SIO3F2]|nr:hypothetical protein [Spirulina sp. SIO3F2]
MIPEAQLQQQLQPLIQQAPDYGVSTVVMELAIGPVLLELARSLAHAHYYILHGPDEQWVSTTLVPKDVEQAAKTVIYLFADEASAIAFPNQTGETLIAQRIPVVELLFQLLALKPIGSYLIHEQPIPTDAIQEIKRADLQGAIQQALKKLKAGRSYLA